MRLSLPSSILLTGAIVALGLYFGLRGQAPQSAPATPSAAQPTEPMKSDASTLPKPPSDAQILGEATALVMGARPRWKTACWDPADPATRKPGRYISALAFDATGKLTVSGVSELRDVGDGNVAHCIRQQVNDDFRISAPGRTVTLEVPFEMP